MNPYSLPAPTKRFHKLGQLLILANNQLMPEHDSSPPILPSNQPFPHTPSQPPPKKNSSPATHPPHLPAPPPTSGIPERNASLQDPPLSVCHQHFNATSECLGLCLEQAGGSCSPPGLVQETAAEVRQAESADPARGDHFYSDASPSSYIQLPRPWKVSAF